MTRKILAPMKYCGEECYFNIDDKLRMQLVDKYGEHIGGFYLLEFFDNNTIIYDLYCVGSISHRINDIKLDSDNRLIITGFDEI